MNARLAWSFAFLLVPALLLAQGTGSEESVVLFKDGFSFKGKVKRKFDFLTDPGSGASFKIPAGNYFVDDRVRSVYFPPALVQDIIPIKAEQKDTMVIYRPGSLNRSKQILPGWSFGDFTAWDQGWRRTVMVTTQTGKFEMGQRITTLTPSFFHVHTQGYQWDQYYQTNEVGPLPIRDLLMKYYNTKKEMKEPDITLSLVKFYHQAGWPGIAEKELMLAMEQSPEHKEKFKASLAETHEVMANKFPEFIEAWHQSGQHKTVLDRLAFFDREKIETRVTEKNRLAVSDWKTKYTTWQKQLDQAKEYLEDFPKRTADTALWKQPAKTILDGLNFDTIPRLETFLTFAEQHARDLKEGRKPTQTTDQLMALAVTGWGLGNSAAEPDVRTAARVLKARQFVQTYMTTEASTTRMQSLASYGRDVDFPLDMLLRAIRHAPPITPHETINTEIQKLDIEVPDGESGSYHVLLPPEYHHHRPYPVMVCLHSPRDNPKDMLARWGTEAARHGYILVAPIWGSGFRFQYKYSDQEHNLVLDTIRDIRRKFNVDSDRTFLFGWETGADMAFDVGLSHPDQFAGVIPMNGNPRLFPTRYWPNGQYLPFYVIEGDRNGINTKNTRTLFKDWIRSHYPSVYVEYKGRSSEWFQGEMSAILEWANKKKRVYPTKEIGRNYPGTTLGEEFRTMRQSDKQFYWLSTDSVHERHIQDPNNWVHTMPPATLQANIGIGNEADSKGGARIWNQVNIRTLGVKQVSISFSPNLIDFTKPVLIRLNGTAISGGQRLLVPSLQTFLEEMYQSADRQRVIYAKVDLRF